MILPGKVLPIIESEKINYIQLGKKAQIFEIWDKMAYQFSEVRITIGILEDCALWVLCLDFGFVFYFESQGYFKESLKQNPLPHHP